MNIFFTLLYSNTPSLIPYQKRNLTVAILSLFILIIGCNTSEKKESRIMPGGSPPTKLYVLELDQGLSWEERNMLSCFQGLVNRKETRIYYLETEQDKFWLDYYKEEFNIDNEVLSDINELLEKFLNEINGYILYNPGSPHTLNIATTIGAEKNLLPISQSLEPLIKEFGLSQKE